MTCTERLTVDGQCHVDGFGGAFIEGIEGDPSGIIGLSLPLARQLTEQLGIEWTDLWNVTRDERFEVAAPNNGGKLPPKENVRQPGDGWVECACGRKHWGTNGAAGVLLARRDAQTGEVTHIVMQHRAAWSAALPKSERQWFDAVLAEQEKAQAASMEPTEVMQDFVRLIWQDRLDRLRGELPAAAGGEAAKLKLRLTVDRRRLALARWPQAKELVRAWREELARAAAKGSTIENQKENGGKQDGP